MSTEKCSDACIQACRRKSETSSMIHLVGRWMSTEKCSDACIQEFGHKSETSSKIYWDDAWALTAAQMLVYKHVGTNPKLLVWYSWTMNEHWKVLRCLYTSIWAQVRNMWSDISGQWMSTEKCSDACIQAFGRKSETYSIICWDHERALESAQMLVCKHLGTSPKLTVWYVGTMSEHWKVLRCLYTSIWAEVQNLWYNLLGRWMSTEKFSDASIQAFGHKFEFIVWCIGTMHEHSKVLRCLYTSIWAQVPNF